jgi:hypothetical protein
METYDVASQTNGSPAPIPNEDEFTKNIESYTAAIPSSTYLGVAAGAIVLSLFCQITGRGKWGNFIAQWVPTWLIIGVYNKVVKLEGHDRFDRGETINDRLGDYSCEFCDSKFSVSSDLENHKKHCSVRTPVS